jgi:hypothetical protein
VHISLFFITTNKCTINIKTLYITTSGDRIPVGEKFSAPLQTEPGAHPASCTMGTASFLGLKSGRSVTLTPHPLLGTWSRNNRVYLYTPYGPYGLYRASVPAQRCTFLYTTTVSLCNLHCYMFRHYPVTIRQFTTNALLSYALSSNCSC